MFWARYVKEGCSQVDGFLLIRFVQFNFPWLLTTIHTAITALGCYILLLWGSFKMTRLTRHENLILLSFSLLYTVNIAISNVSL